MSLKEYSLQEFILKYRIINGILYEEAKSRAFTGYRIISTTRYSEKRHCFFETVSFAYKIRNQKIPLRHGHELNLIVPETLLSLKGKYLNIQFITVVPFRRQDCQYHTWKKNFIRKLADWIIALSEQYFRGCPIHNDFILEHSCGMIACYNGKLFREHSIERKAIFEKFCDIWKHPIHINRHTKNCTYIILKTMRYSHTNKLKN